MLDQISESSFDEANRSKEYWRKLFEELIYENGAFSSSLLDFPRAKQAIEELLEEKGMCIIKYSRRPEVYAYYFQPLERKVGRHNGKKSMSSLIVV